MAEDFTGKVLSEIRGDLAEVKASLQAGFARNDSAHEHIAESLRGLASIAIQQQGTLDAVRDRINALERRLAALEEARQP